MKKATTATISLLLALVFISSAEATLIDRGNGLIYDTVLNITWTQNENLLGLGTWANQMTKANNLVFGGFDDWRLATISSTSPTNTASFCGSGTAVQCAASGNELGYMFYFNLGGTLGSDKTGNQVGAGGVTLNNIPFSAWSGTEFSATNAWFILFVNGLEGGATGPKTDVTGAWAVRNGDSVRSTTPEPGSLVLLEAGLGLLWWV